MTTKIIMELFSPKSIILHIPHSSTKIPCNKYFYEKLLDHEINLLTDWDTDKIFKVTGLDSVKANFSRVFCDVERHFDDYEPMFHKGMGIYYTKTDSGQILRKEIKTYKQKIIDNYYIPHHKKLSQFVQTKLFKYKQTLIIDCHSFSSQPLRRELQQSLDRPDICIGTDSSHSHPTLIQYFKYQFEKRGYSVALNKPYEGTIVPLKYYKKNMKVLSIMIEINKKLYMNESTFKINKTKVKKLNIQITEILSRKFFR